LNQPEPFMHRTVHVARVIAALAALGAISAAAAPVALFHPKLLKSSPSAHDTLTVSPTSVSLWLSEKVELPMTTVKLSGAGGTAALGAPSRDEKIADAPLIVPITKPLDDGKYTINYTVVGKDGHPAKGTIDFVVKSKH
jgi:methionine-rich copper-binding protein CopC